MSEFSLFWTYAMYAGFAVLSFIFVLWKVPETKGMALEDSEAVFAAGTSRDQRRRADRAAAR